MFVVEWAPTGSSLSPQDHDREDLPSTTDQVLSVSLTLCVFLSAVTSTINSVMLHIPTVQTIRK